MELDTVKRRLDFGVPRSTQSAMPDDSMKSIGVDMMSLNVDDGFFPDNGKPNDGITEESEFHLSTSVVTESVESTPGFHTSFCHSSQ